MRIVGIGIDIVEISRIREKLNNKRFIKRLFAEEEIRYCENKKLREQHYAVRFAAKEAVNKALPEPLPYKEIVVKFDKYNKPYALIKSKQKIFLSLSHTENYAIAMALYCK
jgi:holo-[acyl-carrier protein] synthase